MNSLRTTKAGVGEAAGVAWPRAGEAVRTATNAKTVVLAAG
jgi:hypothetical protein